MCQIGLNFFISTTNSQSFFSKLTLICGLEFPFSGGVANRRFDGMVKKISLIKPESSHPYGCPHII